MLNVLKCSILDRDALSVLVSSLAKILDFVEGLSNSIDGKIMFPTFLESQQCLLYPLLLLLHIYGLVQKMNLNNYPT